MGLANFDKGTFVKSGNIGYPQSEIIEQILHDGSRVKKTFQLIVVHHNSGPRYQLIIDECGSKANSSIKPKHISLDEDSTERLFKYLLTKEGFAEIAKTTEYVVVEGVGPLDKSSIEQLSKLIHRAKLNNQLQTIFPADVMANFAAVIRQIEYKKAIAELELMLSGSHTEKEYERWFLSNPWVFGTEYLKTETVKIGWRTAGDIILTSTDGYQDIIELKLPTSDMWRYDESHSNWYPSPDLSKAIMQSIKYIQECEDARTLILAKESVPFLRPRAKIVMGRCHEWNREKLDSLRKLNSEYHNVHVMTYDHLLMSANRMIGNYDESN